MSGILLQHLWFLGLLEVMITFSPSAAQEMQHYHRNKHVSPLLSPFGASCLWKRRRRRRRGPTRGAGWKRKQKPSWGNVRVKVCEVNAEKSETGRDTPSPRGSKIERLRKKGNGGRSGERTGQSEEGKVRKSPLFWFSGRLLLLLQLMVRHKFLL